MGEIKRFDSFSVYMYNYDNDRHNFPHIHIRYKHGSETVIKLEDGLPIEGEKAFANLSKKSRKAFFDWYNTNRAELLYCWAGAVTGDIEVYKIG